MRAFLLATAVLALAIPPALADHCATYSTSSPELDTGDTPWGHYYVDNDTTCLHETCPWAAWIYQESNGIPGLQRDDEIVNDTCHDAIRGDTILF